MSGNYTVGSGSQIRHPSNLSQGLNYRLPQYTHSKSEQISLTLNLTRRTHALIAQCKKALIDDYDKEDDFYDDDADDDDGNVDGAGIDNDLLCPKHATLSALTNLCDKNKKTPQCNPCLTFEHLFVCFAIF